MATLRPTSKTHEVAALEALRDSSAELVRYLDGINEKLLAMNHQNERKQGVNSAVGTREELLTRTSAFVW